MLTVVLVSILMLIVTVQSAVICRVFCAEGCYAECSFPKGHFTEGQCGSCFADCHYAEWRATRVEHLRLSK